MDLERPRDIRVTCAPGLAPFVRGEIERLDLPIEAMGPTFVTTHGPWEATWRLCLELRTAFHVLFPLRRFKCPSADVLYREIHALPWESLIAPDGYLTIESRVDHPSINNSMFPNLRVKDAIVDRIAARAGRRPDSGPERRGVVVHLYWHGDDATISLNASGRKLADRGYRKSPHRAPLQETLAAAIVMASEWDGHAPLLLPMCGSGTLAIEAALIALGRAPGLLRPTFGFMNVRDFDAGRWNALRTPARKASRRELAAPILASDIDEDAIAAARRNAETAGVNHLVRFEVADFENAPRADIPGTLIVNPEYGARLGNPDELRGTYERLGRYFKTRCQGGTCFVLSGNRELSQSIGLKASRRVPFFNADIECRLLRYEMWDGARTYT